jgi:MFS family permease
VEREREGRACRRAEDAARAHADHLRRIARRRCRAAQLRRLPRGRRLSAAGKRSANYAYFVATLAFLAIVISAGVRSAPGVLILPLESSFGWSRGIVSLAAAVGIFVYGLVGPFAAALMQSFGVRRTMMLGLALMSLAALTSSLMTAPWQLILSWGLVSGLGTGCVANVLAATVVNRWFVARRGLVVGLLTAGASTGTLIFLPLLAAIAQSGGWRPVVITVGTISLALVPIVFWLMPEWPEDVGLTAFGGGSDTGKRPPSVSAANPVKRAFSVLAMATRHRDFWLLAGTFFVCGFTTNGLVGTHLIAFCGDHGIPEVRAASLLAMMGVFDLIGTAFSGWLTDRFDSRKLLFTYYVLRGLSLMYLPYTDFGLYSLGIFTVFYGLDWIATIPPTLRLATQAFGDHDAPVVFGWVAASHQLGGASAAFFAGALRTQQGNYTIAFAIAGFTAVVAGFAALLIKGRFGNRGATLAA